MRRVQWQAVQRELPVCQRGQVQGAGRVEETAEDWGGSWEKRRGTQCQSGANDDFIPPSIRWSTWFKEWRTSSEQRLRTKWNEPRQRQRILKRKRNWSRGRNHSTCPKLRGRRLSWCPSTKSYSPRVGWTASWGRPPRKKIRRRGKRDSE